MTDCSNSYKNAVEEYARKKYDDEVSKATQQYNATISDSVKKAQTLNEDFEKMCYHEIDEAVLGD